MPTTDWKYASLPDGQRLNMIRGGNADVYNTEIARTQSAIDARGQLGLDTSALTGWLNTVNAVKTNNNGAGGRITDAEEQYLKSQVASGDIGSYVQFYGATNRLPPVGGGSGGVQQSGIYDALAAALGAANSATDRQYDNLNSQAQSGFADKERQAYSDSMGRLPALREALANGGQSADGGYAKTEQLHYQADLDKSMSTLQAALEAALNSNEQARLAAKAKNQSDYASQVAAQQSRLDTLRQQGVDNGFRQQQLNLDSAKFSQQVAQDAASNDLNSQKFAQQQSNDAFSQQMQQQNYDLSVKNYDLNLDKFMSDYQLALAQYAENQRQFDASLADKQSQNDVTNSQNQQKIDAQAQQFALDYALKQQQQALAEAQAAAKAAPKAAASSSSASSSKSASSSSAALAAASPAPSNYAAGNASVQSIPNPAATAASTASAASDAAYGSYLQQALDMSRKLTVTGDGRYTPVYTDAQLQAYVSGLPLSTAQKQAIARAIGV